MLRRPGELIYHFAVTETEVSAFVDQIIGRCFAMEVAQYVEVYDAVEPFRHEGIMDISLYCACQPEFRFIIAFTQEFGVLDRAVVERHEWRFLVFHQPTAGIGPLVYRMLRSHVDEGTPFAATSQDNPEGVAWIAHAAD